MKEINTVMEKKGKRGGPKEDKRGMDGSQDGGGQLGRLKLNIHQLQKENLELLSAHNQEVKNSCEQLSRAEPPE